MGLIEGGQGDLGWGGGLADQQSDLQIRQGADGLQLGLIQAEAHDHPTDQGRPTHGHGHDLVGLAADDLDLPGLAGAGQFPLGVALDGPEEAIGIGGGAGPQGKVGVGEEGDVGVDALAVVEQGRVHCGAVAAGDG